MNSNKMDIKNTIKKLHKQGVISKKPHPVVPFILTILFLFFFIFKEKLYIEYLSNTLIFLVLFSFIFAILHLIVCIVLEK